MKEKGGGGSEEILGDSTDHQILLHFSIITYFYIKGTYIKSNENTPYLQVTFTQGFFSTSPSFLPFYYIQKCQINFSHLFSCCTLFTAAFLFLISGKIQSGSFGYLYKLWSWYPLILVSTYNGIANDSEAQCQSQNVALEVISQPGVTSCLGY